MSGHARAQPPGRVLLERGSAPTPPRVLAVAASSVQVQAPPREDLADIKNRVETKFMSMWNNMKYAWTLKLKPSFSKESPVWVLGRCYHRKLSSPSTEGAAGTEGGEEEPAAELAADAADERPEDAQLHGEGIEGFRRDFVTRIWMTYRKEFPTLNGSTLTSDCGWGCMLRSGQMLLAQALVCHFLGRSWRWDPEAPVVTTRDYREDCRHRTILKWFADRPSFNSPLGIHQLVALGEAGGKRPGDWYGPGATARLLEAAVDEASKENCEFDGLRVYVAQDCAVYLKDVRERCLRPDGSWRSLVVLVPVRLGAERMNPAYAACLTSVLSLECCVGIIGGRPKHSLYFVGYQDDRLIHLDPHYCQDAVDVWQPNFPLGSFHCRSPRKMPLSKMDPSCCIGFYCADQAEFNAFVSTVRQFLIPPNNAGAPEYPMFVFCEGRSSDVRLDTARYSIAEGDRRWASNRVDDSDTDLECEDFVMV